MPSLCEGIHCRRQGLLRYFGQNYPEPCNNCDACLEPQDLWDASIEVQKILSAIYRTGQMFGANYLIDILRGNDNEKIRANQHDQLKVYGIGKNLTRNDWSSILRQLLNLGYIRVKNWEYRSLALCEKSRDVLAGKQKLELKKLRASSGRLKTQSKKQQQVSASSKSVPKPSDVRGANSINVELFESLRLLRRELAEIDKVPPYIIFSDRTLHDMCAILPRNREQMLLVHGVGEHRFERFGSHFLGQIDKFLGTKA